MPEDAMSHHRAVALALECLGGAEAAEVLAELLSRPGMSGHSTRKDDIGEAFRDPDTTATAPRNRSLRELVLARALYRCGDRDGLGEGILREYQRDTRGVYARHAHAVLRGSE
jgi:hypothetical protein